MPTLPPEMVLALAPFAPLFSERVFEHVQVLMAGAILTPGKRTVSSALRAMGLAQRRTFHRYHRVLSRAKWSSMEVNLVKTSPPRWICVVLLAERTVEIVSNTAIRYSTGLPAVPVRWVVIRDHKEEFKTQALLCTDLNADPERTISWFVKRLSDEGYIPGGPPASRVRNPAALVQAGDPEDRPGVAGTLLGGHSPGPPIHGQG